MLIYPKEQGGKQGECKTRAAARRNIQKQRLRQKKKPTMARLPNKMQTALGESRREETSVVGRLVPHPVQRAGKVVPPFSS
jgi:hypothetical protein